MKDKVAANIFTFLLKSVIKCYNNAISISYIGLTYKERVAYNFLIESSAETFRFQSFTRLI